jgi:DNA-binding GntR family transcriptional regulator
LKLQQELGLSSTFLLESTLQRQTLSAQIYARLEDSVLNGDLPPGTKLSEEQLAERFGVSRAPVREALIALEGAGLAERFGARDRAVTMPTLALIKQKYDLWWVIDVGRAYLSSLEATPEDCDVLDLLTEKAAAAGEHDVAAYLSLIEEYHEKIRSGCRNPDVVRLGASCDIHLRWFEALYAQVPGICAETLQEHRAITAAYRAKDYTRLADSIRTHMLRQRDEVLQKFIAAASAGGV